MIRSQAAFHSQSILRGGATFVAALACAAIWAGSLRHAPGQGLPASAGDRIVAEELPAVREALASGRVEQLLASYANQRAASPTPQAYDCLLGMLAPRGSSEAFQRLGAACSADETFALARVAYYDALRLRDPRRAATYARQAWTLQPQSLEAARAYASLSIETNDLAGAQSVATALAEASGGAPRQALGRHILGQLAWRRQEWDSALLHFQSALQGLPEDADVLRTFAAYIAARGAAEEAGRLIESRAASPHTQALMAVSIADTLNRAARAELSPSADPVTADALARRDQMVRQYEVARPHIPYGVAWDVERLGVWRDAQEGEYISAWQRFLTRVPPSLTLSASAPTAQRFIRLRDAIEMANDTASADVMRELRDAMAEAGWTGEALLVARDLLQLTDSEPDDDRAIEHLEAHQRWLVELSATMNGGRLSVMPSPPAELPVIARSRQRHPDASYGTDDPTVRYMRQKNQYLLWMAEPWETRSARVMSIFHETPRFPIQTPQGSAYVNIVVGEDLMPPAGDAARHFAMGDTKLRNHAHISLRFDLLMHDLYERQADRQARSRLDGHFSGVLPAGAAVSFDADSYSPDTLAAFAQVLFEESGIGSAAIGRSTLPSADETYEFRNRVIEALVDHLARREAAIYGLQPDFAAAPARRAAHANYAALSYERWPRIGLYYMYWAAMNGDREHRGVLSEFIQAARDRGYLKQSHQPLLQVHFLSDMQIASLARELLEARSWK